MANSIYLYSYHLQKKFSWKMVTHNWSYQHYFSNTINLFLFINKILIIFIIDSERSEWSFGFRMVYIFSSWRLYPKVILCLSIDQKLLPLYTIEKYFFFILTSFFKYLGKTTVKMVKCAVNKIFMKVIQTFLHIFKKNVR